MATGDVLTTNNKKLMLTRAYTSGFSATLYTVVSQYRIGIGTTTPAIADNDLTQAIPLLNGTINDACSGNFTGSAGGANSTNNTTTYKDGGGVTDVTSQNLVTTGSNVTKTWTKTVTNNFTATLYAGFWIYIKDTTALAKFLTAGTALEVRWQSSGGNYYSYVRTSAQLAVGWNWFSPGIINAQTVTGTPGTLTTFIINITTNAAGDAFVAGDVLVDLVRTWQDSDTIAALVAGYPTIDTTNMEATMRAYVDTTKANGFNMSEFLTVNSDTSRLGLHHTVFNAETKTSLDEFAFVVKERLI